MPEAPGSRPPVTTCGCHVQDVRDAGQSLPEGTPEARGIDHLLKRLRRIEGQVRGLHRMIDEDRYCADVMTQIASAHEALRGVARDLMRGHLTYCAESATRSPGDEAERIYDDLIELMYRLSR